MSWSGKRSYKIQLEISSLTSEIELFPAAATVASACLAAFFLVRSRNLMAEIVFNAKLITVGTIGLITAKKIAYAQGNTTEQEAKPDSKLTVWVGKIFMQTQTCAWNLLFFFVMIQEFRNIILHFLWRFEISWIILKFLPKSQ